MMRDSAEAAQRVHNPKVGGSNPSPATNKDYMAHHPIEAKEKYVKARVKGASRKTSAIIAGLPSSGHDRSLMDLEKTKVVQAMLGKELDEARKHAGTTKEEVIDLIMEAIGLARLIEDPACMIMGARELSKMLGYNAPEAKKVTHELGAETLKALENLSDAELMKISRGRVIDAEVVMIEGPKGG